ncbi:MAG: serine O-acetyltransferase, partial [Candidatus Lokiarchaeota archaeon]
IDHGAGVVIGETAEVGNTCTVSSGVVLGGTSLRQEKRHPTLGNNVVVGSGAKILGPVKIGDNVRIGANSVVINDVPPNSVVVGVPGNIVEKLDKKVQKVDLRHGDLPDPISMAVSSLDRRIKELEKRILKESEKIPEDIEFYYGEYGSGI